MNKEDFLLDLEHSLSGKGYNTTRRNVHDYRGNLLHHQLCRGDNIFLRNEEMKCSVYVPEIYDDEVWLSAIETKNCYIDTYKHRFIIENYDSVEELADNIIEVVNAYAGTEAKQQKFIKSFIRSMRRCGCRRVKSGGNLISFTYRGNEWEIDIDFSQAPNDIWCFKNIHRHYIIGEELSSWILEFDLEKLDVEDLVEKILHKIDCYLL